MKFNYDIRFGTFLRRPNRFIAHIDLDGTEVICHVPNTGRLRELLIPGAQVMLSHHPSPVRKTQFELRMVRKEENWISIDSQLPNTLAYEAIVHEVIEELKGYTTIKREVNYQNSRFDLQLIKEDPCLSDADNDVHTRNKNSSHNQKLIQTRNNICFVEIKNVTLETDGWSYFPDAPTERGRKHIDELIHAVRHGYRGVLLFVVQVENARGFTPNSTTDPAFSEKVKSAYEAGVDVLAYRCTVSTQEVTIIDKIPVKL
ncbi:DNA/RNA nuclease SfsA [Mobilitalea sibirica]|uniref:Sugar fermentation stimulation protein homolog n=1 Tax=Mobilitalea sibirica TaxID=1462919 RepID=A0A8J7L3A4_9FIRM|nr:DNA/RNA nuclease SfsA [Mobilitalea sibirica]MBH1942158.1 DNA/RNA nuclease SfsA [Mobilitalea sibirica]